MGVAEADGAALAAGMSIGRDYRWKRTGITSSRQ
jgi:hypothetical protein